MRLTLLRLISQNSNVNVNTSLSPFLLDDVFEARHHLLRCERPESEARTPALDGWDDLAQIVTNQAEAHVLRELLYNCDKNEGTFSPLTVCRVQWYIYNNQVHEKDINFISFIWNANSCEGDYTSSKGVLSVIGHSIGFIEDDELEAGLEDGSSRGEAENLFSDNINTSVVRRVQLQHLQHESAM